MSNLRRALVTCNSGFDPEWAFTPSQPESCEVAFGDSGGGIFSYTTHELVGINKQSSFSPKVGQNGACLDTFLSDKSGVPDCYPGVPAAGPTTSGPQQPVGYYRDWILDRIAPPLKVNCGNNVSEWPTWYGYPNADVYSVASTELIDTTAVSSPAAPTSVYRSEAFLSTGGSIVYTANDLLRTEFYTIRLHFCGLQFPAPGPNMDIYVNGTKVIDNLQPILGSRKASAVTVVHVRPNSSDRIEVSILADNFPGTWRNEV
jgi:hypothetical protein